MTDFMKAELPLGLQSYLDHGFSIFPIENGRKSPLVLWEQFQRKAAGIGRIKLWVQDYRNSNWGIVTGQVSGIVVLDFDTEEAEAEANELGLPKTPIVKTPRGRHYYYKHPGQRTQNATGLLGGMDIRGDGGYVVAPPSVRAMNGGDSISYKWEVGLDEEEIAELPEWVFAEAVNTQSFGEKPADVERYIKAVLIDEMSTLMRTKEGSRNDQLNRSAYSLGQLIGHGLLERTSVEAMLEFFGAMTGMGSSEIDSTIRSGIESGMGALEIPCHFFKLKKRNDTCEMILILIQLFLPCKMARS